MTDFENREINLQKLYEAYSKFDDDVKFDVKYLKDKSDVKHKAVYVKDDKVSSEQELCEIESVIKCPIPPSLRETFSHFSKSIRFFATLPWDMARPGPLRNIDSAMFLISTDELLTAEKARLGWVENCFSDPADVYDKVWHNKLGFMTVITGDIIAFDLSDPKDDKRVVYLSHDDGEGHGYILGDSFGDYFSKLLLIGGCGSEDWQMLPFMADSVSGIDPNCDNAGLYREIIGLSW